MTVKLPIHLQDPKPEEKEPPRPQDELEAVEEAAMAEEAAVELATDLAAVEAGPSSAVPAVPHAEDLQALLERAKAAVPVYKELLAVLTSLLSRAHFVAFQTPAGDVMYHVRASGAEIVLPFIGVEVRQTGFDVRELSEAVDACPACRATVVVCKECGHTFETRSAHYMVIAKGEMVYPSGRKRPLFGFASTKMPFFSKSRERSIPPSEIVTENIYKAARSDMLRQALRALGIQRMSAEDLRRAGLDPHKVFAVRFEQKEKK